MKDIVLFKYYTAIVFCWGGGWNACNPFQKTYAHVCLKQKDGWFNELFTGMQYGNSKISDALLRTPLATPGRVSIYLFLLWGGWDFGTISWNDILLFILF